VNSGDRKMPEKPSAGQSRRAPGLSADPRGPPHWLRISRQGYHRLRLLRVRPPAVELCRPQPRQPPHRRADGGGVL